VQRKNPDWFVLIEHWVSLGGNGYSLPFLVGARASIKGEKPTLNCAHSLLEEIFTNSMVEKRILITFCPNLGIPIFGLYRKRDIGEIEGHWCEQVFIRTDVFEHLNISDSANMAEITGCLLEYGKEPIRKELYSRRGQNWVKFTNQEVERIHNLLQG
jgi:hypothetical protein